LIYQNAWASKIAPEASHF